MRCYHCRKNAEYIVRYWRHKKRIMGELAFCEDDKNDWIALWGGFPQNAEVSHV